MPFVNATVIVFVIDLPQLTVSVTTDQIVRGVTPEDLDEIARNNLAVHAGTVFPTRAEQGGGRAAIISEQDGYDAARLLLSGLYSQLAPKLGGSRGAAVLRRHAGGTCSSR